MANFTLDQTGQEIQDILDTVGNNQATQGQVLTADGSGGASWQNASGGKLYQHNINFDNGVVSNGTFVIYSSRSTAYTFNDFRDYLNNTGHTAYNNGLTGYRYNTISNRLYLIVVNYLNTEPDRINVYLDNGDGVSSSSIESTNNVTDIVTEL